MHLNFTVATGNSHFADFQDEKVHFIGTTTVAMESFFHLLKLHKVRLI